MPSPIDFHFVPLPASARLEGERFTVRSRVTFSFPEAVGDVAKAEAVLREKRGYKVGMRILTGQRVERLAFRGAAGDIEMDENAVVTGELTTAFDAYPGERWVGFVPHSPVPRLAAHPGPNAIAYEDELVISPVRALPQLITVAHTFADDSFGRHYILGVRALSTREAPLEVSVSAGYTKPGR